MNIPIEVPEALDQSSATRFKLDRRLSRGAQRRGFPAPTAGPSIKALFGAELRKAMANSAAVDATDYAAAAATLGKDQPPWAESVEACKTLRKFIQDQTSGYAQFAIAYRSKRDDGRNWDDETLSNILGILSYPNGPRALRPLLPQHEPKSVEDYAISIADDLVAGKLVIFDQSAGDPDMNSEAAERVMWSLFNRQKDRFIDPERD